MDTVIRAVVMYLLLLVLFRVAGRRTLGEISTFDFALLLIISEATQQAMVAGDNSITNAVLIIATLIMLDIALAYGARRLPRMGRMIDGVPLVLVEHGRPLRDRIRAARVEEADILAAARLLRGLECMDDIRYAILERDGKISIVPQPTAVPDTAPPHHSLAGSPGESRSRT